MQNASDQRSKSRGQHGLAERKIAGAIMLRIKCGNFRFDRVSIVIYKTVRCKWSRIEENIAKEAAGEWTFISWIYNQDMQEIILLFGRIP